MLSPITEVKKQFGSKEKLVDSLISVLAKNEGESKDAFKKRLLRASSTKLLKFARRNQKKSAKSKA